MDNSLISLVNKYLTSGDNYINEPWFRNLNEKEREFIIYFDASIDKGIEEGLIKYKKKNKIH